MKIQKSIVKRLMKKAVQKDNVIVGSDAIEYMAAKMEEFCHNVTKNAITIPKEDKRKTMKAKDLEITLDSRKLILANLPKAQLFDNDKKEASDAIN